MPMDKFSRLIAAHAFARFPEWRQRVRRVPSSDGTVALLLELPAPAEARVECGLSLSTEDREITISFAAWHEHLQGTRRHERRPGSPEDRARAAWQSAEQFLDDLCAERTVVASWWFESHWRSSRCAPAGSPLEEPDHSYSNRRRVRSWKGTFNEDVRTDTFDTIARLPCPSCGEIDGARCGQAVRGTRRFWFRVTRCPACGAATEGDGGHCAPEDLRQRLLAAEGTWAPVLNEPVDDESRVVRLVRRVLLIGQAEALAFVRGTADDQVRGTRAEGAWAVAQLASVGLRATTRRIDA
jgi:predicted RNA-binding Zn-ribbon protein involved in translation (DUF1610 family)